MPRRCDPQPGGTAYTCEQVECDRTVWTDSESLDAWWLDLNIPHDVAFCPDHDQAHALWRRRDAWRAECHASSEVDFRAWRLCNPYPVFVGQVCEA